MWTSRSAQNASQPAAAAKGSQRRDSSDLRRMDSPSIRLSPRCGAADRQPEQAQPGPALHCLSRAMQLSPQGFPSRQTRQQPFGPVLSPHAVETEPLSRSSVRSGMRRSALILVLPAARKPGMAHLVVPESYGAVVSRRVMSQDRQRMGSSCLFFGSRDNHRRWWAAWAAWAATKNPNSDRNFRQNH